VPPTVAEWLAVSRAVGREAAESDLEFVAAGLAYYSLMAVTPALVFAFLIVLTLGGEALAGSVLERTANVLSASGQRFISDSMRKVSARNGVGVAAPVLALWGAVRLYRGLDQGVEKIFGVDHTGVDSLQEGMWILAFGSLGTFGLAGVAAAASLYAAGGVMRLIAVPLTFLVALVVSYPILEGMAPEPGGSLPGTLFTAVTWTVGAGVVGFVAGGQSRALYGVLGGLLLLLTWFFVANFLLLLGFATNAVVGRRTTVERVGE
jgi:membrane protein